jgi:hypothetical protein
MTKPLVTYTTAPSALDYILQASWLRFFRVPWNHDCGQSRGPTAGPSARPRDAGRPGLRARNQWSVAVGGPEDRLLVAEAKRFE